MIRHCKWIVLVLLLTLVNRAFTEVTTQSQYTENNTTATFTLHSSINKSTTADSFPSRGFALLILRYNETGKDKISVAPIKLQSRDITDYGQLKSDGFTPAEYCTESPWKIQARTIFYSSFSLHSPPLSC